MNDNFETNNTQSQNPEIEYLDDMTDDFYDAKDAIDSASFGTPNSLGDYTMGTPSYAQETYAAPMYAEPTDDSDGGNVLLNVGGTNPNYASPAFDDVLDTLYADVAGANNLITELIERKKSIGDTEQALNDFRRKMDEEKASFDKYVAAQKEAIAIDRKQTDEYVKTQKLRLQAAENQFRADTDSTKTDISLKEQSLKMSQEQFETEKAQFFKTKQLEEEKLSNDRAKFDTEKEQFAKERDLTWERIKNAQRELDTQKEQFAKHQNLENQKLELKSKNLAQDAARFKELVSQFNSGFSQLPTDNNRG